jgi:hypothetical protein
MVAIVGGIWLIAYQANLIRGKRYPGRFYRLPRFRWRTIDLPDFNAGTGDE